MSEDANCALVRRFIDEVFNAGNFDAAEEILTSDYVQHDPTTQECGSGIEGFKRLVGYYRDAWRSPSTSSSRPATVSWTAGRDAGPTRAS